MKPLPKAAKDRDFIWSDVPLGKTIVAEAVSKYVAHILEHDKIQTLFDKGCKFTIANSSLRKYHVERLAEAGVPLIHQQASLVQNTRAYARSAHTATIKRKVANIVAGHTTTWNSPNTLHPTKFSCFSCPPLRPIDLEKPTLP